MPLQAPGSVRCCRLHASARVPFDFDLHYRHGGLHIASGETGMFWFGLLLAFAALWTLQRGFRKDGDFGRHMWLFPPADRDHPVMYWFVAFGWLAILLAGVDLVVAGLIGTRPLVFG